MEQELKPQNIEHDKDVAEVVDDVPIALPPIPPVDLTLDFSSFMTEKETEALDKVQKRASNVMKLAEENKKLAAELKAMSERLEVMERRRRQLAEKEQRIMEEPASGDT